MFGFGKKKDTGAINEKDGGVKKKTGFVNKMKGKAIEKMLKKQLGNLPPEQKAAVMGMFDENPEFFENIAQEIEEEKKNGKSEMVAGMKVMRKYQSKIQQMMMNSVGGNQRASDRNLR